MQSVNVLQIFAAAQQTSCRATQLHIRENVKSALGKQTGEFLKTYRVWFSKCFAAVNNKYVMMTIQKIASCLRVVPSLYSDPMFQHNIFGNLSSPTYPEILTFERNTHALDNFVYRRT